MQDQSNSVGVFYVCAFWGEQKQLDLFLQAYAVEMVKLQARRQGQTAIEQPLADGSIRVQIAVIA